MVLFPYESDMDTCNSAIEIKKQPEKLKGND